MQRQGVPETPVNNKAANGNTRQAAAANSQSLLLQRGRPRYGPEVLVDRRSLFAPHATAPSPPA